MWFERYQNLAKSYYYQADGFVIVFDMTEQSSLTRADEIFDDMIRLTGSKKSVLLGNKCDLEHQVSDDDIAAIEKKHNTK